MKLFPSLGSFDVSSDRWKSLSMTLTERVSDIELNALSLELRLTLNVWAIASLG